jgi:nitroreductase
MDVSEAVAARRSIRAFKPDPVPKIILREIVEKALRAPSWANIQPWELAIACGPKLDEIRRRFAERKGIDINPDFPQFLSFPEPYDSRSQATVAKSHESVGIKREDKEKRAWWELQQLNSFGAPCEIYIYIERSLYLQNGSVNVWPVFDCGTITVIIALLAASCDLGTIIQARAVIYPDIIREVLGIPDTKLMLIGMGIGYPDLKNPVNKYSTDREPMEKLVGWYGFLTKDGKHEKSRR